MGGPNGPPEYATDSVLTNQPSSPRCIHVTIHTQLGHYISTDKYRVDPAAGWTDIQDVPTILR